MTTVGYQYKCAKCRAVLADTSKHTDGSTRGMDGSGAFFVGRKLTAGEVISLRDDHACFNGMRPAPVREVAIEADTAQAFFDAQERQCRAASEVGDALKPFGFSWWHTGGGCTAWGKQIGKEGEAGYREILMTDGDCSAPARLSDVCSLGVYAGYSGEADALHLVEGKTVAQIVKALRAGRAAWAKEVLK